ncbi:MAG: hypothetical protein KDJ12_06355, partial [Hyphomicrobiales bacterium]|nr:hypothetical protein [Hyphomicrobiales bacterium]
MAVGDNVAIALAGAKPLRVWNAGGDEPLRIDIESVEVAVAAKRAAAGDMSILVPPLTAQPVTLPSGDKKLDLDLAPGTAVFAAPGEIETLSLHAVNAALSRSLG